MIDPSVLRSALVLTGLLSTSSFLQAADAPAAAAPVPSLSSVQVIKDIVYRDLCEGEDPALDKNKLDLYLPKGKKDVPVLFFVHGGAWRQGDKSFLGMYSTLGQFWARQGIATVVTNYRLSPAHKHPAHIEDVAKAFAWTWKNIGQYGGRQDQIFVCGHSAGGHLVSLLATDESYLRAEGLTHKAIRGAIPISGVFRLVAEHSLFTTVFGKDRSLVETASPVSHVGSCPHPPFLIIYADKDFPTCDKVSEEFCKSLREKSCNAETLCVKDRNHISVLVYITRDNDPVAQAMKQFISLHAAGK
jgi:acetyl esterase/lipase